MKRRIRQNTSPPSELPADERLRFALTTAALPYVDLHGMRRDDVRREVNDLVDNNPDGIVRIVYGHGTGALAEEVLRYLRELKQGKAPKVTDFIEHPSGGSCVVKVR